MPIPDYQSIMLPMLTLASDGAEHRTRDVINALALHFKLTEEELATLTRGGNDVLFDNRAGWARTYLKKAGLLFYPSRGRLQITDAGQALLAEKPAAIDVAILKRYPSFMDFWNSEPAEEGQSVSAVTEQPPPQETPEEFIALAHEKLRKHLQSELLSKVLSATPGYFEKLVVRLLTKMGYGGSLADAGQALGRPHDGGIDGVIKEDKLGLNLIYIQAKRWTDATVDAPEVQKFVGALAGKGKKARRGVFITTSKFTKGAINYAAGLENNVVLIDGDRLTELMFEYGLGVVTVNSYDVKRVDNDFFDDDEI